MDKREKAHVTVAVVVAVLALGGLAALGAASLGIATTLRIPGLAALAFAGAIAAVIRRTREARAADGDALVHLAVAQAALTAGDDAAAARAASAAAAAAKTSTVRNRALTALAWAALGQGYAQRAKAALDGVRPPHAIDLHCLAAVEDALGRTEFAIQALEVARGFGGLTSDAAKLLVDCHLRQHGMEGAVLAALQNRKTLGAESCQQVVAAARFVGANEAAARLASVLRSEAAQASSVAAHERSAAIP
jgi:hypothetical protein